MTHFNCDGVRIYYEVHGEGRPLLFINGLAGDTRQWEFMLSHLTSSFQCIIYDMRCAGRSDKPDEEVTVAVYVEEALALLHHLDIKKADILGFSLGGMIAMEFAMTHPEVVDNLILLSTMPYFKGPYPIPDTVLKMMNRTDVCPDLLSEVYETIFGHDYKGRVSADDFISFRLKDDMPQPADAYLNQLKSATKHDMCYRIKDGVKSPTIICAGDDDHLIPPENAKWLQENIDDAKLFMFEGAGHMLPIEVPEKIARMIQENI
ncbi:MAG: alpha/beta hydrolase [Deltaproteobacteria bacterium]|jgi:pimeloyl-ACP methyl ester carboxylesterase|nr:alpha/beta hydrolase [Deltaproteobacteria bacterium]